MLVPLPSNHIVKFWFLELPKTHLEFLMTHQERQRACLQLITVTAISRKEKLHCYIWNPQMQVAKDPPPPNTHSSCWVSDWWITDCSEMWRWASELTNLGLECWEAPGAALLCIISSHCTVIQRFSNLHLPFTCQPLLHGQISLWIAICTISSLHQTSLVPSTGCPFFSSTVSKHDVLDNLLWTGCLKIYTNCDWEHCGLQCTAEWHQ